MQSSNVFETSIFACASLRVAVLPLVVQLIGIDSSAGFGDGGVSVCMWLRMHGLEGDPRIPNARTGKSMVSGLRCSLKVATPNPQSRSIPRASQGHNEAGPHGVEREAQSKVNRMLLLWRVPYVWKRS